MKQGKKESSAVVGVIPSRWGSTRFPGKSLALLGGKPMIRWVVERARMAKRLDDVLVATDDDRIRKAVEGFGGRCVMTRSDHPSGTDRVAEAVGGMDVDIVINIQGDEPLIDPLTIDELAEVMTAEPGWDMGTAVTPFRGADELRNPAVVKVALGWDGRALFFSRSVIPFDRDGKYTCAEGIYRRHVGIYAYRAGFLRRLVKTPPCMLEEVEKLEQLRALYIGGRIRAVEAKGFGIGVDTPADIPAAEAVMRSMGLL